MGPTWEEIEKELEPLIKVRVKDFKGRRRGNILMMAVVGWTEGEEIEMRLLGIEGVKEGRGSEEVVEELRDDATDDDLTEREGEEDLVERILREMVDRRAIHRQTADSKGTKKLTMPNWILRKQLKKVSCALHSHELFRFDGSDHFWSLVSSHGLHHQSQKIMICILKQRGVRIFRWEA